MSIALLYAAETVGPVCKRLAAFGEPKFNVISDEQDIVNRPDVVVRWGSSRDVPAGPRVINTAEAIVLAKNKKASRKILGKLAPKTWFQLYDIPAGTPVIVRPKRHHAAKKFFVCKTREEVQKAIAKCGLGWYASEIIDKQAEFRVFVLQGRVVAVSQRFPAKEGDIAWNMATGGKLINANKEAWPMEACAASIKAAQLVGLDWSAVDVAIDQAGNEVVFELNTAPGLRNKYTMGQIAKALGWAKEVQPAPAAPATWKDIIHPALRKKEPEPPPLDKFEVEFIVTKTTFVKKVVEALNSTDARNAALVLIPVEANTKIDWNSTAKV